MSETAWTHEWPTKPGFYWLYGWPFGNKRRLDGLDGNPELVSVSVRRGAKSSVFYVAYGTFIYQNESSGVWTPAILPDLPGSVDV